MCRDPLSSHASRAPVRDEKHALKETRTPWSYFWKGGGGTRNLGVGGGVSIGPLNLLIKTVEIARFCVTWYSCDVG